VPLTEETHVLLRLPVDPAGHWPGQKVPRGAFKQLGGHTSDWVGSPLHTCWHWPLRNDQVPLAEHVAVGVPSKPDKHTAEQLLPAGAPVQLASQPLLLLGAGSVLVMLPHETAAVQAPLAYTQVPFARHVAVGAPVKFAAHVATQLAPCGWPLQLRGQPVLFAGTATVLMLLQNA
jgi:hypothetical protein